MKYLLPLLFIFPMFVFSQTQLGLTPRPVSTVMGSSSEKCTIDKNTVIIFSDGTGCDKIAKYINGYLNKYYAIILSVPGNSKVAHPHSFIELNRNPLRGLHKDQYDLKVSEKGIVLTGATTEAIFYGAQTLFQLFTKNINKSSTPSIVIPAITISDYPRFQYRGMHLDVSRHFFEPSFIKKYIDYLAYHKFNYFHWHLTEDQGWRIEIKKYPLLTSVGGYRNGTIIGRYPGKGNDGKRYGGFYTQEEIKDIVQYASDRFITIIPEIEMPGHSSAAIAAYPQLSCFPEESTKPPSQCIWSGDTTGKQVQQTWGVFDDIFSPTEYTFNFLENVLDEVMELFPSPYIHIGGDEAPKTAWKRSAFCQQLIKDSGLKDEHGLQSYFIQRIEKYINSKGRKIIGWDEILEGGLAPNSTVMSWRGEEGGIAAAKDNHDVIMTPGGYCYLDHSQSKNEDSVTIGGYLPLDTVYGFEPIPKKLNDQQAKYVLGAQGNVWTEYMANPKKVEYMIFPRMTALSEVLWSPKENRDWKDFERRLPVIFNRYQQWGANYSTSFYGLRSSVVLAPDNNGILWKLETKSKYGKIMITNKSTSTSFDYKAPIHISSNSSFIATLIDNQSKEIGSSVSQQFSFNKATGKKITLTNTPAPNYPGSGAFTLVNGIITENKLSQSSEWLGFLGKDLEAVIDLGKLQPVSNIRLDILDQQGSWIYPPAFVEFFTSNDGIRFTSIAKLYPDSSGKWPDERHIQQKVELTTRYIKVFAKNLGIIPQGKPGAGTPAWLFADEIEVE